MFNESFEELVEKVQSLQRSGPEGKLKWMSYAHEFGNGRYDPKYHTREYILEFFKKLDRDEVEIDPTIEGAPGPVVSNEVFVGHLPQDIPESAIYEYFCQWGEIQKIEYKEARGFCFITFASEAEVEGLLKNHAHHRIRAQWVDVKRAENRRKGSGGGSFEDKGMSKGGKGIRDSFKGYGKGAGYGSYPSYGGKGNEWWSAPPPSYMDKGGKSGYGKGWGGKGMGGKRAGPY